MMKIWAHRGCSQMHPENTIESFETASHIGNLTGIELDIQLTKDGEIVVIHDEKVDRTTNGIGYVKDFTLSQIKSLSIWTASSRIERIPTISEVLDVLEHSMKNGLLLNIELKTGVFEYSGIEEKISEIVHSRNLENNIIYSSFSAKSLLKLISVDQDACIGILDNRISDCYVKATGIETIMHLAPGSVALHPFHKGVDINVPDNRPVRAFFTGHLFPEPPTGGKLDFDVFGQKGITDVFINEPEKYL